MPGKTWLALLILAAMLAGCAKPTMTLSNFRFHCNFVTNRNLHRYPAACSSFTRKRICNDYSDGLAALGADADLRQCLQTCDRLRKEVRSKTQAAINCIDILDNADLNCKIYCRRNYEGTLADSDTAFLAPRAERN
ncbi:hypothetical protein [Desulfohalovibrio reitneri]|uniref:hypothetical protein n=1 Tax=Desulfohalovibrio reitneri TaxID=1307759 RepID=UPI0004A6AC81|nr:hypothetical protein [Desulfohalovibrio reitneri]